MTDRADRRFVRSFRLLATLLRPWLIVLTKRDWRGVEHMPKSGPVIVASNHTTEFDPLVIAHFMYDAGRIPRILAKASLWKVPVLGWLLTRIGQIPVVRGSRDAALAYRGAIDALDQGDALLFYVEGTITKDPDLWPMTGNAGAKTGAARLALTTGAPVVPLAQWGAHEILAPYGRRFRFFPRKTIHILAGPAIDLSDLAGRDQTAEVLRIATDRIMTAITSQLGELRGELPPADRFNPSRPTKPAAEPKTSGEAAPVDEPKSSDEAASVDERRPSDEAAPVDEPKPSGEAAPADGPKPSDEAAPAAELKPSGEAASADELKPDDEAKSDYAAELSDSEQASDRDKPRDTAKPSGLDEPSGAVEPSGASEPTGAVEPSAVEPTGASDPAGPVEPGAVEPSGAVGVSDGVEVADAVEASAPNGAAVPPADRSDA